jgi:hypothetical protein
MLSAAYYWIGIALVAFLIALACLVFCAYALNVAEKYRIVPGLAIGATLLVLIGLMLPVLQGARVNYPWASCQNNMHNIALALQQYEIRNGTLPPAYIADADGKPMHSWRVLLLPYLEQNALYRQYRFDEPWDGPNNSQLHTTLLKIYLCPSEPYSLATSYVVVTGSQTIWPGATPTKLADITDGPHNTIILVEVHNSGIHWMEPRDLDINKMPMAVNAPKGVSISSAHHHHGPFANIVFADGRSQPIPNTTSAKALRAALTISGGEKDKLPTARLPR